MEYKWLGQLTEIKHGQYGLVKTYNPDRIIVWYDKLDLVLFVSEGKITIKRGESI